MSEQRIFFYPRLGSAVADESVTPQMPDVSAPEFGTPGSRPRLEPATCTEAETFVLQVLDSSMEPEFRKGCMIVIDPTGRATDGSYVVAQSGLTDSDSKSTASANVEEFVFRQLRKTTEGLWELHALDETGQQPVLPTRLEHIIGVVVQRAGVRRRYHKRYDTDQ